MKRFAVALALIALAIPAHSQQTGFGERIDVNAVLLDVIVTDSRGNQILGLSKEDFIVKEGGVVQAVDSVDYFTSRTLLSSREDKAPFRVEKVREDRYFVFFFDKPQDPASLFGQLMQARASVTDFISKQMRDTDYVAIVGHDMRLKVYSDFTRDRGQLVGALGEALRFGRGLTEPDGSEGPSILRALDREQMINGTGTVYQGLGVLGAALRSIGARKNLVLFSPGIVDHSERVQRGFILDRSNHLDPALEWLNAANVSVYAIQLQREAATDPVFHQRLSEIAESTGGRYFQLNTTFRPALRRIEQTNSGYYLVTYRAKHPSGARGFQKVDVSVKNPEFRVVARSGYQFGS
jgi:VWFA-related protein